MNELEWDKYLREKPTEELADLVKAFNTLNQDEKIGAEFKDTGLFTLAFICNFYYKGRLEAVKNGQ